MHMRAIINGLFIAFTANSGIPVPEAEWNKKNMQYAVCFFPFIGIVTGALLWGWHRVCDLGGFGQACFALTGPVIPVFITGGIYLSGFINTAAALHTRDRKCGKDMKKNGTKGRAFNDAVIAAVCYFMLSGAGMTLIWKEEQLVLLNLTYIISGTLYGMSLMWFATRDKEGTSYMFSSTARVVVVRAVLVTVLALEFLSAVLVQPVTGAVVALAAMWVWTYYYYMTKKRFGGITDDTAGYFVCLCELVCVLLIGIIGRVM